MALRTGDLLMALFKKSGSWKDLQGEELKKLKSEMAGIVDDIVKVCEKYNFTYILAYGSALGAIRHKGYIPWDDDIDLCMPRKDYDRFLEIAESEMGDKYYVRCVSKGDDIAVPTCHVKKKGTHYVNFSDMITLKDEPEDTKCIYVDIFPLENTSNIGWIRTVDGYINLLIQFIIGCIVVKDSVAHFKSLGIKLTSEEKSALRLKVIIGKIFGICSTASWFKLFDKYASKNKNDNSKYVTSLTGYKNISKSTYLRDKVCNTTLAEFEGRKWNIPIDYDYYLKTIYNEYMVMPDPNHRKVHPIFELEFSK